VGIGVNVNNSTEAWEDLEVSGALAPASIADLVGRRVDLTSLAIEIVQKLENEFLNDLSIDGWREGYLNRLAFRGEMVQVLNSAGEVEFEAVLDSVANDGSLVLQMPGGPKLIYTGSIRPK
jgi:biotin-(acetyl-CoA carboxylase) ligase